ncbi:hypothetical protein AB1Y20_008935 [Prymnesium parvum]|uniref:Uncharacterized protein n=1 Tax=Prymnesium parvum TaxID=97485 RepID=A0AB34K375_PRYPA
MVEGTHVLHESAEARELREARNARSKPVRAPSEPTAEEWVELPTPAGSVFINLAMLEQGDATRIAENAGDGRQELSRRRATVMQRWHKSTARGLGLGMHHSRHSLSMRRFADSSMGARTQSAKRGKAGRAAPEPSEPSVELKEAEEDQRSDAERAKLAATRSAQQREEIIKREHQVRQMWRAVMGTSAGLAAEIAKVHATQEALRRLEEYEIARREKERRPRKPSVAAPFGCVPMAAAMPPPSRVSSEAAEPRSPQRRRSHQLAEALQTAAAPQELRADSLPTPLSASRDREDSGLVSLAVDWIKEVMTPIITSREPLIRLPWEPANAAVSQRAPDVVTV